MTTTRSTTMQRWVLALTATAAIMVALDQLVVATALNRIRDDLHASLATLDWTVNAYSLTFAALLLTGAALGDRFGRRRLFVAGLALFSLSSVACAQAPNVDLLIAARAIQGVGAALVMPLAVALLTAAFPVERRGPVVGMFAALTGIAVVGGPILGGAVTDGIAWQWIFWINVPIGLVLIPLVLVHIEEGFGGRARPDLGGLVLATAGMFGVVWGLIRVDAAGWSNTEVLSTIAAGTVFGVGFVLWEQRVPEPMLPMHLFRNRVFAAGNGAMLLLTASLFSAVFILAQYLQVSLGYSPLAAGLRFLPWTGTIFLVAPLAGAFVGRLGPRRLLVSGLTLQGLGLGWVAFDIGQGRPYIDSVVALVIAGCGTSMAIPAGQTVVMNSVPPAFVGKASGVFNSARQLGGVLGIAALSAVFAANGTYASARTFQDGAGPAIAVAAGLAIAGAVVSLLVVARTEHPASAPRWTEAHADA